MFKFLIISSLFVSRTSCCFHSDYSCVCLIFVGSSYDDYEKLTTISNFHNIFRTKYFNVNKPSVLIIHGWQDEYQNEMANTLVNAFLTRPEFNIIFADWSVYAENSDYAAVVGSLTDIAQTFVNLLLELESFGYDLSRIHIIGLSLGAHMAGTIGNILQSQNILIHRITGLDPAGPLFVKPLDTIGRSNLPGNFLLSKGDAAFVDIIHTNAGTAGTIFSTGDLDFWPNGGSFQPICEDNCTSNVIDCSTCNHVAAWRYFAESVLSPKLYFTSFSCPFGDIFPSSMTCTGPSTALMGFYASQRYKPGNYYLEIVAADPYTY